MPNAVFSRAVNYFSALAMQAKRYGSYGMQSLARIPKPMLIGGAAGVTAGALSNSDHRVRNAVVGGALGAGAGYGWLRAGGGPGMSSAAMAARAFLGRVAQKGAVYARWGASRISRMR